MERELPFLQHLHELRRRLIISVLAVVVATVAAFVFYEQIIQWLLLPADDLSASGAGGENGNLVFIELTEMLAVSIKVSLVTGLVVAFPVVLYQIIMFVAPGLTSKEKRHLFTFMPGVVLAFGAGVAFGYFVVIPPAFNFLLSWGNDIATPTIRISNYVNLVIMLLFWMGIVFETPVVMFILAKLGIVSPSGLARWRRYWVVVAFILGALITPTFDPVNQSLVAVPLIVLYELGILLAKVAARQKSESYPRIATPGSRGG